MNNQLSVRRVRFGRMERLNALTKTVGWMCDMLVIRWTFLVSFHAFAVKKRVLDAVPIALSCLACTASYVNTSTRGTWLYFSVETQCPLKKFCRKSSVVLTVVGKSCASVSRRKGNLTTYFSSPAVLFGNNKLKDVCRGCLNTVLWYKAVINTLVLP